MSENIMKHCNDHKLISDSQHAYRSGRSTVSASLSFINIIIDSLENKKKVAGIFLDLSKAFDSVNHELLLKKLMVYGIRDANLALIKSFLSEREQTVEVKIDSKKHRSQSQCVEIGIPQGSSLGNALFVVFVNDISKLDIQGQIIQYADDTTVILSDDTIEKLKVKIKETLSKLDQWFKNNGLQLNSDKTNIMFFNAKSPTAECIPIDVGPSTLCSTNHVKLLGFELDSSLTWKIHIDATCTKMAKGVYALKQMKHISTPDCLKGVYYSYIHSIMSYGIIMWGCSTDYERILKMQKRAIRVLVNGKYKESCREHFKDLQILTAVAVYILEAIKHARQNIIMYQPNETNSIRNCKSNPRLKPIYPRLCISKKSPMCMGHNCIISSQIEF